MALFKLADSAPFDNPGNTHPIRHLACLLATVVMGVWIISAQASVTRYLSFSGCIQGTAGDAPSSFTTGCYEGRIGYEQENAETSITVTEFWVEVNDHRFDMANFSQVVLEPSENDATESHLMARFSGVGSPGDYGSTGMDLSYDLENDQLAFYVYFGSEYDWSGGAISGGTIIHYPASAPLDEMNVGLNDAWFKPDTAGQGFFLTILPVIDKAALAWYTHDTSLPSEDDSADLGDPGHRWLVSLGPIEGNRSELDVELTRGGIFDDPGDVESTAYGTFVLTFDSCASGTVEYDLPTVGRKGIVPIQRVAGDNTGHCEKLALEGQQGEAPPFLAAELLGRPTSKSVTVNVIPAMKLEGYYEYGPAPGDYRWQTDPQTVDAGTPLEQVLTGLTANGKYYYRLRHRAADDDGPFLAAPEHSFRTQRPAGETFTFVVQADPHLDDKSDEEVYRQTLSNEAADQPDFLIDLGDDSMVDKCVMNGPVWCNLPHGPVADYLEADARNLLNRQFFADISHSIPVFMILGNHEAESGWRFDGSGDSMAYWDLIARKKYYPNPVPDDFYTGSDTPDPHVGLRENYYAWEWGDALFVVLDPFGYSENGGGWGWSLGKDQYDWMVDTLGDSDASFKFVFMHNMVGGGLPGEPGNKSARGGALFADYFEWGGYDPNEAGDGPGAYVFDTMRPGWGRPIRDVFVETGVTIFFHGHDHLYAAEEIDGMVYQEVPQPSHPTTDTTAKLAVEYGYGDAVTFSSSGHLRVTVSPQEVVVDYVRSFQPEDQDASHINGTVMHSYTRDR